MTTLTVRVPPDLKERMLSHPELNWSAFIRKAIDAELERMQRNEAAQAIAEVRAKIPSGGPGAVQIVRSMREGRRGVSA